MKERRDELNSLILENQDTIRILVCGNSKNMPQWVEETFVEILADKLGKEEARAFINQLIAKKRYVVESW